MSAPVLTTTLNRDSDEARQRIAHNRALAEALRARVAEAALGGNAKSRERHTSRGKLLPRERVERLLDPGSPLLELGQHKAGRLSSQTGEVARLTNPATTPHPRACVHV